jgi:ABC transporter, ATP-binding protein
MEDNELRDIILEKNDEQKSIKIKKLLMFVAMFFILFLIVLITMKIVNSGDELNSETNQDSRLVLPPEPQAVKESKGGDELFQQVPIIPENKGQDSFEDMVKSLKDKEAQKQSEQAIVTPSEEKTPNVQELIKEQPTEQAGKSESRAEVKSVVIPKEQPKLAPQKEQQAKTKPEPKQTTAKEQPKPQAKKTDVKPSVTQHVGGGSYIQVVAVKNFNENAAEIKKLKSHGYSYKLHKVTVNGTEMTKVVVGPYSQESIKSELAKIKSNVASSAFIVNIK